MKEKTIFLFVAVALFFAGITMTISACQNSEKLEDDVEEPDVIEPEEELRYGVKWSNSDVDDLGQRCFAAEGKTARIGIGATDGESDFDEIYPWSEIRRCNVKRVGDQEIVVYEGDPEFALDGSQGDVFVRIPKFGYQRYVEDGYEYRVISREGTPHPAFIENGQELDAIYVGAFEGLVDDGALYSRADVIPSSDYTHRDFLNFARSRGRQYTLYDLRTVDLVFTLFAVEYGCRNSGVVLGYGVSQYKQGVEEEYEKSRNYYQQTDEKGTNCFTGNYVAKNKISAGSNALICNGTQSDVMANVRIKSIETSKSENYTRYHFEGPALDISTNCFIGSCAQSTNWCETCAAPLTWHTGRADMRDDFETDKRNPMRYRWIENIVGNLWHYLPDVMFLDGQMYACENMEEYEMYKTDGAYKPVGPVLPYNDNLGKQIDKPGYNFWVTSMMLDADHPAMTYGQAFDSNISCRQAFGAFHYIREGKMAVANGGGFDHEFRSNILTNRAWIWPGKKWYLYGARLQYKPLP